MFSSDQVDKQGSNGTYVIDAADPSCSNWLRFVNSPTKVSEENVIPVSCEGIIFYMTTRDVEPGTELLVWYGDSYGRFLGVNRIHPGNNPSQIKALKKLETGCWLASTQVILF